MSVLESIFNALESSFSKATETLVGKRTAQANETRNLLSEKLEKVLMPMDKLLSSFDSCNTQEKLNKIKSVVNSNYCLVPSDIYNEIEQLISKEDIEPKDLDLLKKIVSSHFNHARRALGYPFDPYKINAAYTPAASNSTETERKTNKWIAICIVVLTCCILIIALFQLQPFIPLEPFYWIIAIIIALAYWYFSNTKRNV